MLLFTAPAFFPRELLTPALHDVARLQPADLRRRGACAGCCTATTRSATRWLGLVAAGGLARRRRPRWPTFALERPAAAHMTPTSPAGPVAARCGGARSTRSRACAARCCRATIAPVIFLLGMSGQFGRLTGLDGFPTDSYLSWIVPLSLPAGRGLRRRGDRARTSRATSSRAGSTACSSRPCRGPCCVVGPDPRRRSRARWCPTTVVLVVGLALGAELTGGVAGPVALYVARVGLLRRRGAVGRLHGRHVPHAAGRAADAAGRLPRGLPLDRLHAAGRCCSGWLGRRARGLNPVTHVLELGAPGDGVGHRAEPRHTPGPASSRWPGCRSCSARWRCSGCAAWGAEPVVDSPPCRGRVQ